MLLETKYICVQCYILKIYFNLEYINKIFLWAVTCFIYLFDLYTVTRATFTTCGQYASHMRTHRWTQVTIQRTDFFIFCVVYFQNMDFTIANSKLLLCLRNVCEIKILCRFLKFYLIHLSRLLLFKFSWKQFNSINLCEKERSNYKWIKKKLWIKDLLNLQNLYS